MSLPASEASDGVGEGEMTLGVGGIGYEKDMTTDRTQREKGISRMVREKSVVRKIGDELEEYRGVGQPRPGCVPVVVTA